MSMNETPATPATNSSLLPEGEYEAKPIDAGSGKTPSKGTHFARVKFEITRGPFSGRTITQDFWLTEKTWEDTEKALLTLGWNKRIPDIKATCVKPCSIVVEHEDRTDNQGNKRKQARVRWVNRAAPQLSTSEASELAELLASWGAEGISARSSQPAPLPAAPTSDASDATQSDDDIPF
ncbi:MAG: hypothetical protein JNK05_34775 [Myxococcales bacterium]|nr:hypothetical protein [Myxococcales bacterium]